MAAVMICGDFGAPQNKKVSFPKCLALIFTRGFPGGSDGKELACNAGELGLIPGLARFPVGGYGNPLQYSCLDNPMDREGWWGTVHGVAKSWT